MVGHSLILIFSERDGYERMKKAQISVPLVEIEPATPYVRGGSLERLAIQLFVPLLWEGREYNDHIRQL